MPKIVPPLFGYDPSVHAISPEQRRRLNKAFNITLTDQDCQQITDALGAAEGEWRSNSEALDHETLLASLRAITETARQLADLLSDPGATRERRDAALRVRIRGSDKILQSGDVARDGVTELVRACQDLAIISEQEEKRASSLETTSTRTDRIHLKRLLKELAPVLDRHGLQTSYTTDSDRNRNSPLADFAFEVAESLPQDARPVSIPALTAQLVVVRKERKLMLAAEKTKTAQKSRGGRTST